MSERRVAVIGASTGVGAAVSVAASQAGARVAIVARRHDLLRRVADQCTGVSVHQGDVRKPTSVGDAIRTAIDALGGLDVLVYAAGMSPLGMAVDTSFADWQAVFETNVIGLGLSFAASADALSASRGRVLSLSSYSMRDPKAGLVPYAASKAALEKLMQGLRAEHPQVSFSVVSIAATAGTEFTRDFDPTVAAAMEERWKSAGTFGYQPMLAGDVAEQIIAVMAAPMVVEKLTLVGPTALLSD
jgi:NADP-dependent 3-hydroxy acid dehydrogenase YdfG